MTFFRRSRLAPGSLALAVIIIAVLIVFGQHVFGYGTFIGESDRLNSYLNVRLWEYDAMHRFHHVPSWSWTMFGGFPVSALHWMNPGTDPISFLLQGFPREQLFTVLGYCSALLVIAACFTAFLYFRALSCSNATATVGAVAYGLSVISLHRVAQVDNAHLTIVLLPLMFLSVRSADRQLLSFVTLTACMAALAFWGFLQEVGYAFIFTGTYALYRVAVLWNRARRQAIQTLLGFACASAIAVLFALPRLLDVAKEVVMVSRTSSLQYYGYVELLRFFHEGMFGRSFAENRLVLGNGMNVHEGLQLSSSAGLIIVVCVGILRPTSLSERIGAILFCALFIPLIQFLAVISGTQNISTLMMSIVFWACVLAGSVIGVALLRSCVGRPVGTLPNLAWGKLSSRALEARPLTWWVTAISVALCALLIEVFPSLRFGSEVRNYDGFYVGIPALALVLSLSFWAMEQRVRLPALRDYVPDFAKVGTGYSHEGSDAGFHLFALIILLFMIVTLDGYRIVYFLFAQSDFTHSRLSTILILSVCSLFCVYLSDFRASALDAKLKAVASEIPLTVKTLTSAVAFAFLAWLLTGPIGDKLSAQPSSLLKYDGDFISKLVVLKLAITVVVILGLAMTVLYVARARHVAWWAIAAWVVAEATTYGQFKIAGPHTWTYPVPFRGLNYLNVPTNVLRPPSQTELDSFEAAFETDKYRSILEGGTVEFIGSNNAFVSCFWEANSIGGYGTGVPNRLASLPWDKGVQTLRTLEIQPQMHVDPGLLAFLNVKYVLRNTPGLYFNVPPDGRSDPSSKPADVLQTSIEGREIQFVKNRVAPLPREFLVRTVVGTSSTPEFQIASGDDVPAQGGDQIIYGDRLNDLPERSIAEGFDGSGTFDASGSIDAKYEGDNITVKVAPSDRERFVVLNMRYHPDWRVKTDGFYIKPYPTNITMMGFVVPRATSEVTLRFQPFSTRLPAKLLMWLAFIGFLFAIACMASGRGPWRYAQSKYS
jgi:hypothetical protein